MKTLFLIATITCAIGLFSFTPPLAAQGLPFNYAVECASGPGSYGWGPNQIVVDNQGCTYVAGQFSGVVLLGNTILTATQTPPNRTGPSDSFIAKLDRAGNYLWAVQIGDNQSAILSGLAVDSRGDVYVAGGFDSYSLRFGATGPTLFNSSSQTDIFVAKLNGTTRQWVWARRAGGLRNDYISGMEINTLGEIHLTGSCAGTTADFGPFTLQSQAPMAWQASGFVAKMNSLGNWLWAQPLGSAIPAKMVIDAQNDVYLAGSISSDFNASFGAITLSTQVVPGSPNPAGSDVFVAKANAAGTWLWALQGDAISHQNLAGISNLALDNAGHLYVAGSYSSTAVRLGPTQLPNLSFQAPQPNPLPPVPYTNNYYTDAFVARLNTSSGAWDWATRRGGPYNDYATHIVAESLGRTYVAGFFNSPTLVGNPADLTQFAQLDGVTGAWHSVRSLGPITVNAMAMDAQSQLSLAGSFYNTTVTFGATNLSPAGMGLSTGYIARMATSLLGNHLPSPPFAKLAVWPNPSTGTVWVQGVPVGQPVRVMNILGQQVGDEVMPACGRLCLNFTGSLHAGVYIVSGGGQAQRFVIE